MSVVLEIQLLKNLKHILQYNWLFALLGIFCLIYCLLFTVCLKYKSKYSEDTKEIIGKIEKYSFNGDKLQMTIKAKEDIIATYYIASPREKDNLLEKIAIGKTIKLSGTIKSPMNNTVPNNFNYRKYLYHQKIFYLFSIDKYEIYDDNNILDKAKDYLIKRSYSLENGDFLLALVLGDKSLIGSDEYNLYQKNGTSHLLAISGSHVAVLLAIFGRLFKRFKDIPKLLILSFILLFFGFVTDFQAAVNRAIIFFIINQINKIFALNYSNLHILLFTAFLLIILNPFVIYDLGFIYSFVVCGGIIYNSDKITGNYITKLFKLSFIAFLYSLPISAFINYEVNIASIIANMFFVPWISLIVFPLSILTFIVPLLNPLLNIVLNLTDLFNTLFSKISIFINVPKMSLLLVLILFIFIILSKNKKRYYLLIVTILIFIKIYPRLDNNFCLYYLDVGQGDSAVLISPHQDKVIMIDTGGKMPFIKEDWTQNNKNYNLSDNTIKFLKSQGITKIDYLIISHGDYDHLGEAIYLINNYQVGKVIFNNDILNTLELDIIATLEKKNIKYYQNVSEIDIDENKLLFLKTPLSDNENDNSNVIYLNYAGTKLLFMGDAGTDVEDNIIKKYNLENIDILKVGHHGSKTSTSKDFISSIRPQYSIISVGRNNRYNHPNQEVLDNLKNSIIYRTDINGTIMFKIKNDIKDIKTYEPYK